MSTRRLEVALQRIGLPALAGVVLSVTIIQAHRLGDLGLDFRSVSGAIRGLPHGIDPYRAGAPDGSYIWSVLAGWLLLPIAEIPDGYLVAVALEIVGIVGAALLLGVRDWRLIAVALAWPATVNSVQIANITVLILVLLAAGWRDRESARCGLWIGLAVAAKFMAWPALIWLAATRRWRALGVALAVQVGVLLATLPYLSLGSFLRLEENVDQNARGAKSVTLGALLHHAGLPLSLGDVAMVAAGAAILMLRSRDFGWVAVSMLVMSPVVWLHYFDLLLIPLALWTPRLAAWFLPMLLVVVTGNDPAGEWWRLTLALSAFAAIVAGAAAMREQREGLRRSLA